MSSHKIVLYNGNFSFQFQFQHALIGVEGKLQLIYLFIRFVRKKMKILLPTSKHKT